MHFRSKDPQLASEVANAVATTYIEHNFQTKYKATLQTSDWLTKQLDDLKKHAESAQETLTAYQKKTGILGTDETHNIILDKLEELNKDLSAAEGDRIVKEAKYRIAMTENPELIANIAPESVLGALYKERAEVRSQYAQWAAKYGASYPRVVTTAIADEPTGRQHQSKKSRRSATPSGRNTGQPRRPRTCCRRRSTSRRAKPTN